MTHFHPCKRLTFCKSGRRGYYLSGPELTELPILNMNTFFLDMVDVRVIVKETSRMRKMTIIVILMPMNIMNMIMMIALTCMHSTKEDPAGKGEYTSNQGGCSSTHLWIGGSFLGS